MRYIVEQPLVEYYTTIVEIEAESDEDAIHEAFLGRGDVLEKHHTDSECPMSGVITSRWE